MTRFFSVLAALSLCPLLAQAAPPAKKGAAKASKPAAPPPEAPAPPETGPVFVYVMPIVDGVHALADAAMDAGEKALKAALTEKSATLLSPDDPEADLGQVPKASKPRAYELKLTISRAKDDGLKAELLVASFPSGALKGSWSVTGSGAPAAELVEAIVPKVVADAADDLKWKAP